LATPVVGGFSYGPQVADFADRILGKRLMGWQRHALDVALTVDESGRFVSSKVLISVGRQNGKTTVMESLIGWLLTEFPKIEGRKISILSTAHELDLAVDSFLELADVLKDGFGAKVTYAYGRNQVIMPDGSLWKVKASTGKKHGGTWDVILGDELWCLSEAAVFGALLPSQIAVPNPLSVWLSTAGDESSSAFLRFREQGLGNIDKGTVGDLAFMEWSVPTGVDPMDQQFWGMANPALGTTITLAALKAAAEAPDKIQFMRAHLNQWVSAAGSWLAPNLWAELETADPIPDGGVLAIDSSVDDARFIGVRGVADGNRIHLKVEFVVDTETKLWQEVERLMADPALLLALTPSLEIHCPKVLNRRYSVWGYGELLKFTTLVRGMIYEKRVNHHGETVLAEHMNRAVMAKTVQGAALSSQKSAGPIELARASVIAVALASKPVDKGKPFIVVGNR
jgi:phage terminase large subunit-like protein